MSSLEEGVETFVILPFTRYKALDQKSKKVDPPAEEEPKREPEPETSTSLEVEPPPTKPVDHQDVRLTYRSNQMKKLLHHIKAVHGGSTIAEISNLDNLIENALTQSKKKLPNEEEFYTFLFEHRTGSYVKNCSKIDLYCPDIWYRV